MFRIGTVVGLLHGVDDGVLHRQPAVPVAQHAAALLVTLIVGGAAIVAFPRLSPGPRAAVAGVFGILVLVNGSLHVVSIARVGMTVVDVSGVAAAVAGVVLVGLSVGILLRHRRDNPRRGARRWLVRGAAAAGAVAVLVLVLIPFSVAIGQVHPLREPIEARPSTAYRDVRFMTADGTRLSGWYSPSSNGAAIVLVNTAGGDRNGSIGHARLLAAHGYGVLLYDARGTGRSEGEPNAYGWTWTDDIRAAVTYLTRQPTVCRQRIGALGLSTGADALLAMGGQDRRIRAIVTDGATERSMADLQGEGLLSTTSFWVLFHTMALLSGQAEPDTPLRELVADISPTPLLLIASGSIPQERPANATYARAAGEPVELWDLPDVDHTAAIRQVPDEYEARVVGHFDRALLPRARSGTAAARRCSGGS